MHTVEIFDESLVLYMPGDLSECTDEQYLDMCELIFRFQTGQLSYKSMRHQATYRLLNLRPSGKMELLQDEQQKWANLHQLSELIDNFFNDEGDSKVIKLEFTHVPVTRFRSKWKFYYGPADNFINVTFGEYIDALRTFMDFSKTGDYSLLCILAAILYRPATYFHWIRRYSPNYNGDIRQPYNSRNVEERAEGFRAMPAGFIYGAYLLFASFQKYITGAVIPWAGREIDFSILFDSGTSDQMEAVPGIGMDSLAFALAESGQFGDLEGVRRANLWEVLILLYDLRKKDLDYKLNSKSNK